MVRLIQLQRLDSGGENIGGLYVNVDLVEAVMKGPTWGGYIRATIQVGGRCYDLAQGVSEVLDAIADANNNQ